MKLNDTFRFLLINENKKSFKGGSQTNGVHLYYIKDYNNRPVIMIDSQGYGDTRGTDYDIILNKAFEYTFSKIIDHINAVCFVVKSSTNRLDINTKYIFSSVTSLFAEDITENFIVLATFASKQTMIEGPEFIETIKNDAEFLKLQKRMDENWYYAFDSLCLLDNDIDKLTNFSFKSAIELYEDKIKKLKSKSIKKCAEVLKNRNLLITEVNKLDIKILDLFAALNNLENQEKICEDNSKKLSEIELQINNNKSLSKSKLE